MIKQEYINEDLRVTVDYDSDPLSPREWDNFGIITCPRQGKYSLADKDHAFDLNDFNTWQEVEADIRDNKDGVLIFPLGIYDHSGLSLYIGSKHDRWDGGQVGFIYCTKEDMKNEGIDEAKAEEILRAEIDTYDAYLKGEVYSYRIEIREKCSCGECEAWVGLNSCSGYFSIEDAFEAGKEEAEVYLERV